MSGEGAVLFFFHFYFPHFIFESFYYLFFLFVFVVCIVVCIKFLLFVLFILFLFSVPCDQAHHCTLDCKRLLTFELTHVCSSAEAHIAHTLVVCARAPHTVHNSARVQSNAPWCDRAQLIQNPHVTSF
jgi:hypothetical protein